MHDCPVQCGGATIANNPGMDNKTSMFAPDGFRNSAFQKWGDNQIWLKQLDGLVGYGVVDIKFDGYVMPAPSQFDKQALCQTVETVCKKQNLQ